jgi:carbonic anhydrase
MGIVNLIEGHRRFAERYVPTKADFIQKLAIEGQRPEVLVVCCSDSRVIPELITGAGPGSLFVVRNIGNLIPSAQSRNSSVGAAIEFAIDTLRVSHLLVLGHYGCGGMTAVKGVFAAGGPLPTGPLADWLFFAKDSYDLAVARGALERADWLDVLVEENVLQQLANALTFESVRRAIDEGRLELHAWTYHLASGKLLFYDADRNAFLADNQTRGALTPAQVESREVIR